MADDGDGASNMSDAYWHWYRTTAPGDCAI